MALLFLVKEHVLRMHADLIRRYGGEHGLRDEGLLESSLAMPQASFGGEYFHRDLFEMAAAYHFHLVKNHPFIDGNKRIGAAAALAFLFINGVVTEPDNAGLVAITLAVAEGKADKFAVADHFRQRAKP